MSEDGTVRLRETLRKQKVQRMRREKAAATEPASGDAKWGSGGGGCDVGGSSREGMIDEGGGDET